jgi:hypothetical protein
VVEPGSIGGIVVLSYGAAEGQHLERAGFVVMQRAPIGGGAALGRGFEG